MKRVLVTGGAGFIGRHVCEELLRRGHRVRVLDALIEQVHSREGALPAPEVDLVRADIRDADAVRQALEGVDAVIHLAAEVGVGQSMYEIARYVGANDLGTAVLLEAMIGTPVERIVVASSMSVYGEGSYHDENGTRLDQVARDAKEIEAGRWSPRAPSGAELIPVPTDETKPIDLASIYALTKYAQERQVMIFGRAYGVDAVALRLFNVMGPGQALSNPYTGVLANFASRLASGNAPTIFEDGRQQRDFVHVRDVAAAFCQALERPAAAGEVFNIGSGRAYSIVQVARLLASAMGLRGMEPEILSKYRKGDIRNCFADIGKAREVLGYEPAHLLEDSLGEFAAWVEAQSHIDRNEQMRRELETRGLVA